MSAAVTALKTERAELISHCRAAISSLQQAAGSTAEGFHTTDCLKRKIIGLEELSNKFVRIQEQYLLVVEGNVKDEAVVEATELLILLGVAVSEAEVLA